MYEPNKLMLKIEIFDMPRHSSETKACTQREQNDCKIEIKFKSHSKGNGNDKGKT